MIRRFGRSRLRHLLCKRVGSKFILPLRDRMAEEAPAHSNHSTHPSPGNSASDSQAGSVSKSWQEWTSFWFVCVFLFCCGSCAWVVSSGLVGTRVSPQKSIISPSATETAHMSPGSWPKDLQNGSGQHRCCPEAARGFDVKESAVKFATTETVLLKTHVTRRTGWNSSSCTPSDVVRFSLG